MTTPQHHDDPIGEGAGRVLQALAALATVGEAAARVAAIGAQNRATQAERRNHAERVAEQGHAHAAAAETRAHAAQVRAHRQVMDQAFDPHWLAQADLHDTAVLWRTATIYALSGDQRARRAMRLAQQRLAHLNPGLMMAFDRRRREGANIAEAMRAAATDTWQHQTRTSQPPDPASDGADPPATRRDLDAAIHAELSQLASTVDPGWLEQLERQWRGGGHASAADAAARIARTGRNRPLPLSQDQPVPKQASPPSPSSSTERHGPAGVASAAVSAAEAAANAVGDRGERLQQQSDIEQARLDQPATVADEHHDGLIAAQAHHVDAQHDLAEGDQQRRLARSFRPLGTAQATFSHAAARQAAPTATPRKGSVR